MEISSDVFYLSLQHNFENRNYVLYEKSISIKFENLLANLWIMNDVGNTETGQTIAKYVHDFSCRIVIATINLNEWRRKITFYICKEIIDDLCQNTNVISQNLESFFYSNVQYLLYFPFLRMYAATIFPYIIFLLWQNNCLEISYF